MLCSSRIRWYGHVERIKGFISQVRNLNVVAQNRTMNDVRGDFLGPPHGTTPAALIANKGKTEILLEQ